LRSSDSNGIAPVRLVSEHRASEGSGPLLTVAAAQLGGPWLNASARLEVALEAIEVAAAAGAEVIGFPETYLSGYPLWVSRTDGASFDEPDQKASYAYYLEQAIEADGQEVRQLAEASSDLGINIVMGASERGSGEGTGTVWCSIFTIDAKDGLVGHHRKLMPTYDERLVWGQGDATGLVTHPVGAARLGSLSCWENWMPQARSALYAQGENVHLSVWPGSEKLTGDITRFIALEGRVFSVAVSGTASLDDIPDDFPLAQQLRATGTPFPFQGGTCIAAPNGEWLVPPVVGAEGVVVAELALDQVAHERLTLDPTGHYARPDVFRLSVQRHRRSLVEFDDLPAPDGKPGR
jgi:nitrilase